MKPACAQILHVPRRTCQSNGKDTLRWLEHLDCHWPCMPFKIFRLQLGNRQDNLTTRLHQDGANQTCKAPTYTCTTHSMENVSRVARQKFMHSSLFVLPHMRDVGQLFRVIKHMRDYATFTSDNLPLNVTCWGARLWATVPNDKAHARRWATSPCDETPARILAALPSALLASTCQNCLH